MGQDATAVDAALASGLSPSGVWCVSPLELDEDAPPSTTERGAGGGNLDREGEEAEVLSPGKEEATVADTAVEDDPDTEII